MQDDNQNQSQNNTGSNTQPVRNGQIVNERSQLGRSVEPPNLNIAHRSSKEHAPSMIPAEQASRPEVIEKVIKRAGEETQVEIAAELKDFVKENVDNLPEMAKKAGVPVSVPPPPAMTAEQLLGNPPVQATPADELRMAMALREISKQIVPVKHKTKEGRLWKLWIQVIELKKLFLRDFGKLYKQ